MALLVADDPLIALPANAVGKHSNHHFVINILQKYLQHFVNAEWVKQTIIFKKPEKTQKTLTHVLVVAH